MLMIFRPDFAARHKHGVQFKIDITPPNFSPFTQTQTGTVAAFGSTRHPLTVPRAGNLTLRLTWNDPAIDLDLYLTSPACQTSLYPKSACGVLLQSDAPVGTTSETIARTVANGDSYQVWVDNLHLTRPATYTLVVTIQ